MDSLLPSVPTLLVLTVLEAGPAHGYEIARRVELASAATLELKEGTLYPLLYKLEREGLLSAAWQEHPRARRVRIYELTDAGRSRLAEGRREWEVRARGVIRVLRLGEVMPLGQA